MKSKEIINKEPEEIYWRLPVEDWGDLEYDSNIETTTKKIMAIVGTILEDYERSRNDDFVLAVEVWRRIGQVETAIGEKDNGDRIAHIKINVKQIPYLVSFETISRCRRKYNQKGEYLPTNPKVIEARMKKEKTLRQYFKNE